jgi:hypothetical protein
MMSYDIDRKVIHTIKFDGFEEGDVVLPPETLTIVHTSLGDVELHKTGGGTPDARIYLNKAALDAIDEARHGAGNLPGDKVTRGPHMMSAGPLSIETRANSDESLSFTMLFGTKVLADMGPLAAFLFAKFVIDTMPIDESLQQVAAGCF